jgi:hypothetical protein
MDELEDHVRAALRHRAQQLEQVGQAGQAGQAGQVGLDGADLLPAVHARSWRIRRRRRAGTALTVAVAATVTAVLMIPRLGERSDATLVPAPPAATGAPAPTTGTPTPSGSRSAVGSPPATSATPAPGTAGTTSAVGTCLPALVPASSMAVPVLTLRLGTDVAARMYPPQVSLVDGELRADYAARDYATDADITLAVAAQPPQPPPPPTPGPVSRTTLTVRGHAATLRRVSLTPTDTLDLTWQEGPGRWVQLRTDDTYTAQQVTAFAEGLLAANLQLPEIVRFGAVPAGWVPRTMTDALVVLGPGTDARARVEITVPDGPRPGTGSAARPVQVAGQSGYLIRDTSSVTVELDSGQGWVRVRVVGACGAAADDPDVLRLAAAVHPAPGGSGQVGGSG